MLNVPIGLSIYIFCISLMPVTPVVQTLSMRRLESLTIRMENLEVNLRNEQETSETLQAVVKELRTEIDESGSKISTGDSDKISEIVVKNTTRIIRNDLQSIRHGLVAEKARGLQLAGSQQECKEHVITTDKLVKSLQKAVQECKENANKMEKLVKSLGNAVLECTEHTNKTEKLVKSLMNAVQECKEHANKTDTMVGSFGSSVIRKNISRLSEDISELKINRTVRSNTDPEQSEPEVVTDTATCSQCLLEADTGLYNLVNIACQNNISYLHLVMVNTVTEGPSLRKIHADVLGSFGKKHLRYFEIDKVVMTEPINCSACPKFTPGTTYLFMTQDMLKDVAQQGNGSEFHLNNRFMYVRFPVLTGRSQPIKDQILASRLSEFMKRFRGVSWPSHC